MVHPLGDKARELRRQGKTLNEISAETGLGKSTVRYMVRDVVLTAEQQLRIQKKKEDNWKLTPTRSTAEGRLKGGKNLWLNNRETAEKNIRAAIVASSLSYLPHEKEVLRALVAVYGSEFHKEKINGVYFDFVNDSMVIEHTVDIGKGITSATNRFRCIQDDKRKKIIFVNKRSFGSIRRNRLIDLGVEVHYTEELDAVLARLNDSSEQ